jgi:hypothetical protein
MASSGTSTSSAKATITNTTQNSVDQLSRNVIRRRRLFEPLTWAGLKAGPTRTFQALHKMLV